MQASIDFDKISKKHFPDLDNFSDFSQVYFNEMAKLNLLNEEQLSMLFGNIEVLLPLHEGNFLYFKNRDVNDVF